MPFNSETLVRGRLFEDIRNAVYETANPISARITVSGYEGSELLVARLLIEAGAEVPYVGTACLRTEWSEADRDWLEAHGAHVMVSFLESVGAGSTAGYGSTGRPQEPEGARERYRERQLSQA